MAYIEIKIAGKREKFPLRGEDFSIGRGALSSLVLPHPQVSREHARIRQDGEEFVLEDLGSRHGTYVDGRRIDRPTWLREGQAIDICGYTLCFRPDSLGASELAALSTASLAEDFPKSSVIMTTVDATLDDSLRCGVRPEAKLRALLEITRAMHSTVAVDDLLSEVLDGVLRIFPQAQHGVVLLVDQASDELIPKVSRGRDRSDGAARLSQTAVKRAFERKEGVLSADTHEDAQFEASQSISELGICSILCAPLLSKAKEPLGVLHVHSESHGGVFHEEDLDVLVSVAGTAALALENVRLRDDELERERIRRETELAWDVQRRFLPASAPEVPSYGFYHFYEAARWVGGDYYAFVPLPGHRLAVAIGDVSGKGIPAAMLMARLSSDVRYALLTSPGPADALQVVNHSLSEAGIEAQFVSLLLMVLDWEQHTLTLANAGHPPPMLRDSQGNLQELGAAAAGFPLNVSLDLDYAYTAIQVHLEPGMTVLAYTDGVTEARNEADDMFGSDRLFDAFKETLAPPVETGERLIATVSDFVAGAPQHDDTTLICFGRAL